MTRIRADLVGTVHVRDLDDVVRVLSAGDEVPDGAVVGEHLIADQEGATSDPADDETDEQGEDGGDEVPDGAPRGNASRAAWASYATAKGVEVSDEMSREDIKAAVTRDAE